MKSPTWLPLLGIRTLVAFPALFFILSCTTMPMQMTIKSTGDKFPAGTILSARTGQAITFDELLKDLAGVRVVYVGETHTNSDHHAVQNRLIKALSEPHPDLTVGMEMFDHTYQPRLNQW